MPMDNDTNIIRGLVSVILSAPTADDAVAAVTRYGRVSSCDMEALRHALVMENLLGRQANMRSAAIREIDRRFRGAGGVWQ